MAAGHGIGERDQDVWLLSAGGDGITRRLFSQPFVGRDARFSPDGQFVAYVSEETGRPEVSVQTLDGTPRREVISVGGGNQPVWSRDGRELFFVDPQGLLRSAPASRGIDGRLVLGAPALLNVRQSAAATGAPSTTFLPIALASTFSTATSSAHPPTSAS